MNLRTKLPLRPRIQLLCLSAALLCPLWAGDDAGLAQSAQRTQTSSVLEHLNAIIAWYRHASTKAQYAGQPSDAIYQVNAGSLAAQAVQTAFQAAKAEAAILPAEPGTNPSSASTNAAAQHLNQTRSDVNTRIATLKSQLAALDTQIAKAPGNKLQDLQSQRNAVNGALDLNNAVLGVLNQISETTDTAGNSDNTIASSIAELERSVPELAVNAQTAVKAATPATTLTNSQGLIGEVTALYEQLESMHQINLLIEETETVRAQAIALRAPLQATLRATIEQGQVLAGQLSQTPSATSPVQNGGTQTGTQAPAVVSRQQFDALAAKFKQIAAAALPLRQEVALLDQSRSNFTEWHDTIERESAQHLRSILIRVVGIAIAIGLVLLLSEMWKRVTFRYIHDIRRRRQFLLLRRIVVGFCMGLVLILGFVSEFSSLATFAGFITAGLAVGLQTILLSVAAYFFLVGRWGIRVGDRISVAGVTGDVVDVGLVRLYLLELAQTGVDLYPTGRVVVFANSVLFQATTPLFKQLPGTEYTWHEVVVPLQPGADYKVVEEKALAAVDSVYQRYRDDFVRQHGDVERRIEIQLRLPEPHGQLQYSDTGLEYMVRYPVGLEREAEADGEITLKLLELQQQPDMKATLGGTPKIRAAIKN
jgi:small-conductance mechanosensitive channel